MKMLAALFAAAFLAGVARHLWRVARGAKPSTLVRLADEAERSTFIVSMSQRVADQIGGRE